MNNFILNDESFAMQAFWADKVPELKKVVKTKKVQVQTDQDGNYVSHTAMDWQPRKRGETPEKQEPRRKAGWELKERFAAFDGSEL